MAENIKQRIISWCASQLPGPGCEANDCTPSAPRCEAADCTPSAPSAPSHGVGARALLPATRCQSSGPLGALLSSPALDVRLMTALQVLQVGAGRWPVRGFPANKKENRGSPALCVSAGRGPVPFYPSPSRGVRFIYLFFAFPENSRENRGCLVLHSGNSRVSLSESVRAGLGQNLRQN